jgi:hypothetical protein
MKLREIRATRAFTLLAGTVHAPLNRGAGREPCEPRRAPRRPAQVDIDSGAQRGALQRFARCLGRQGRSVIPYGSKPT